MPTPAPFNDLSDIINRSLNIKHVYGEPVQRGDTTVIPVAKVRYGFGAGGGRGPAGRPLTASSNVEALDSSPKGEGAGGGGGVVMSPAGALEIGPGGTRFIHFQPLAPLAIAGGIGAVLGLLLARRR